MKEVLKLFSALNTVISIPITEQQYSALHDLKACLSVTVTPSISVSSSSSTDIFNNNLVAAQDILVKYIAGSDTEFSRGVTFFELKSLVSAILSPIISPPKFGFAQDPSADISNNTSDSIYSANSEANTDPVRGTTYASSSINFIQPSEILCK